MRTLAFPSSRRNAATIVVATLALAWSASPASASSVYIVQAEAAATGSSAGRTLDIGRAPHRAAFMRFTVGDLDGAVRRAKLRVFKRSTAATAVRVRRVTTRWSSRSLRRGRLPALGSTIVRARTRRGRGWRALDVTRALRGRTRLDLALVVPKRSRLRVAGRGARGGRAPRLRIVTGASAPPFAPDPLPSTVPPHVAAGEYVPYDSRSPWNTPVGDAAVHPASAAYISAIADNGQPLTSDVDQFAIPVYKFDASTPRRTVKVSGHYSTYDAGDNSRRGYGSAPTITGVPIPDNARPSAGSDGQIVIWDPVSGTEYAFWRFARDAQGSYTATNGYRYHTTSGYFGRFADGLAGRGAGLPYLGGLVRKWEIDRGRIAHALAFAYDTPSSAFVFPASKSDGGARDGSGGTELPEGTRLQLDPALTDADFTAWGLSPAAKTIARALQEYGMYVVDVSGSPKIFLEDRVTAGWDGTITRDLVSGIPWQRFRAIVPPAP
jgi:hypothetical protein